MRDSFSAGMWRELGAQWGELRRVVGFGDSLAAWPAWLAPPLAIGALLALIVLSGVALVSLGALLTTLLAAALLLEHVFGVHVVLP
ncbi:MAG: hypothetical protein ABI629_06280 [bacterium]